jgi:hypothetical protein
MARHHKIVHYKFLSSFRPSFQRLKKQWVNMKDAGACYGVSQVGLTSGKAPEAGCALPIRGMAELSSLASQHLPRLNFTATSAFNDMPKANLIEVPE